METIGRVFQGMRMIGLGLGSLMNVGQGVVPPNGESLKLLRRCLKAVESALNPKPFQEPANPDAGGLLQSSPAQLPQLRWALWILLWVFGFLVL